MSNPARVGPKRPACVDSGTAMMSDGELLSILFRRGPYTAFAIGLAHRLLERFGGVRPLRASSFIG